MTESKRDEIWPAAAAGDDAALDALVRTHHDRVYRFGRRMCRDEHDADDAVQEAFITLARRRDVIEDAGALSWLMAVVRNACRRLLRPFARQRRAWGQPAGHGAADEIPSADLDPQQTLERWELIHAVHGAIAALPRAYREVLVLRDLEGLDGAATCAVLGIDLAAMKTRLHRARASLRAALADGPDAPHLN